MESYKFKFSIAEPKALIGFAGPRVIQQTVGQTLPTGFQRSEFLLEHGALDMILDRRELRDSIYELLDKLAGSIGGERPATGDIETNRPATAVRRTEPG